MSTARDLLRHSLATLAYRGGKVLRDAPAAFPAFRAAPTSRSAGEILAHLCDLFDWTESLLKGEHIWREEPAADWEAAVQRFHAGLERLDARLASAAPLGCTPEQLLQGPVADAFTHVGQLALLRRLAGAPVRGENYFRAQIRTGCVGPAQAPPVREFD